MSERKTSVFVQWKGTDVCLDFHCKCGADGHLDDAFAYYLRCSDCGRTYRMPALFEPVEMPPGEDWGATREPLIGEVHENPDPRLAGIDVVTVAADTPGVNPA